MKQRLLELRRDRIFQIFLVFLLGMAVYYGYRMFEITPWYDELYTYYYFISRGPVYAAIHWPLPNNHVGFSTLSACLNLFGSSAVALRGVSWLSSLGSLVLLYRIGRKCFAGFCIGSGVCLCRNEHGQPACGTGKRLCACNLLLSHGPMGTFSHRGGASEEEKRLCFVWAVAFDGVVGHSQQPLCGNAGMHDWRHDALAAKGV